MDEINEIPLDSQSLKNAIESTKADIQAAVLDGNAELLIKLDNRMRILSARSFGVDCSETKKTIDSTEQSKIKIAKEIKILREIKKNKNLALGRAQILYQKRLERVNRAEFEIQLAENKLTSARVLGREANAKLQKLLDAKQRETSVAYEKY